MNLQSGNSLGLKPHSLLPLRPSACLPVCHCALRRALTTGLLWASPWLLLDSWLPDLQAARVVSYLKFPFRIFGSLGAALWEQRVMEEGRSSHTSASQRNILLWKGLHFRSPAPLFLELGHSVSKETDTD